MKQGSEQPFQKRRDDRIIIAMNLKQASSSCTGSSHAEPTQLQLLLPANVLAILDSHSQSQGSPQATHIEASQSHMSRDQSEERYQRV